MSNVGKFEELLRSDEALQAKLKAAGDAYQGDWSDEKAVFDAVIAPLAEEAGFPFVYEEGKAFMMESVELSDEELEAVAGGGGSCYIGGGGDSAGACTDEEAGAGACIVMGVTFFNY